MREKQTCEAFDYKEYSALDVSDSCCDFVCICARLLFWAVQDKYRTVNGCDTFRWGYRLNGHTYLSGGIAERGDVIAFKPNGSSTGHSSIKRVIGLPGETIQIKDGMIYIDGEVYLEKKSYPVITNPGMASDGITLGNQEYFVLGDNRNNSVDSRFADVGTVKASYIEGKVWFVLSPSEHRGMVK